MDSGFCHSSCVLDHNAVSPDFNDFVAELHIFQTDSLTDIQNGEESLWNFFLAVAGRRAGANCNKARQK